MAYLPYLDGFPTDSTRTAWYNHLLRGAASLGSTLGGSLYLGLSRDVANFGGSTAEVSGGAYARVAVPRTAAAWTVTDNSYLFNASPFTFPVPTADWGVVRSAFLADALTGGRVLWMWNLANPTSILAGTSPPPSFPARSIHVGLSRCPWTDDLNGLWLDELLKGVAFAPPATLYAGLSLGTNYSSGLAGGEMALYQGSSRTGYARVPLSAAHWPDPIVVGDAPVVNLQAIQFPAPTADWTTGPRDRWPARTFFLADRPRVEPTDPVGTIYLSTRLRDAGGREAAILIAAGDPAPKLAAGALMIGRG